jgi:hypothetical protein
MDRIKFNRLLLELGKRENLIDFKISESIYFLTSSGKILG